jgi:nonribosomal peptide synthetase DhbF
MRLLSQLRARTGLELALRTFFEYPTVEGFASQLTNYPAKRLYQPLLPLNKAGSLPPLFCFPPAGGISTVYKNLSDELGAEQPLWGLQARGVDDDEGQTDQTVRQTVRTYIKAIKEIQPSGPYYLLGHSLGGIIAHEAAVQLEAGGDMVSTVFILDCIPTAAQSEVASKPENDEISEALNGLLKDATVQELPLEINERLNFFQTKFEQLGMIPLDTPKAFVMNFLKNMITTSSLTKNHVPSRCQAEIVFFRATRDAEQNTLPDSSFDWHPYTAKPLRRYEIPVGHVEMLWQPVSFKFIAHKVHEVMSADAE